MEKKKIAVFVAGQKLTLITCDSEKYVSDIASKVDTAINSLLNCTNMSREKCAVMAALDFCDDEAKARADLGEIKEQIKDYIRETKELREENDALKAEIEKLKGEKEELIKSKKTLIASAVEIKNNAETEIDSSDDLSFDFDEDETAEPQTKKEALVKAEPKPATYVQEEKKADKKRHNHEHKNPYKERFLKEQHDQKGYTPLRQYSLFDTEN